MARASSPFCFPKSPLSPLSQTMSPTPEDPLPMMRVCSLRMKSSANGHYGLRCSSSSFGPSSAWQADCHSTSSTSHATVSSPLAPSPVTEVTRHLQTSVSCACFVFMTIGIRLTRFRLRPCNVAPRSLIAMTPHAFAYASSSSPHLSSFSAFSPFCSRSCASSTIWWRTEGVGWKLNVTGEILVG